MKIACLTFNPIQENTYVVWDDTKECAVIDAGNSTPKEDAALDGFLAEHGLKPVLAVNTHGHFDHVLGVEHLRKTYGIPFALSGKDAFMLDTDAVGSTVYGVKINAMPTIDIDLDKVEEVKFGHTVLRVIRTPGHAGPRIALRTRIEEPLHGRYPLPRKHRTHGSAGRRLFVDHAFDPGQPAPAGRRSARLSRTRP